jgi:hypothetical protein
LKLKSDVPPTPAKNPKKPEVAVPERYPESIPYQIPVIQSYLLGKLVTFIMTLLESAAKST